MATQSKTGKELPSGHKVSFFSNTGTNEAWKLWAEIEGEAILGLIAEAGKHGVGLTFGTTRDGGCVVIAVLYKGNVEKTYAATHNELLLALEGIAAVLLTL